LKAFPKDERPNVMIPFYAFRLMAAIGFLYFFVMVWAALLWRRRRLFDSRAFLWTLVAVQPLGFLATETGWLVAEVGRQPWVVYNLLKTAEGVSPIASGSVVWSLCLFLVILAMIGASYFYYVIKTLRQGPDMSSPVPTLQRPSGMPMAGRASTGREQR
jgi:cytochrome d ubiquinol oxidase subunit I